MNDWKKTVNDDGTVGEWPTYYIVVDVKLTTGESIEAWLASNGDEFIWTKLGENKVYYDDAVESWKYKNQ